MQSLGTLPGHATSEAVGVNESGVVIGNSTGPDGTRAFVWTARDGLIDLGTLPGGTESRALGINGRGLVVGTSSSTEGTRAFVWKNKTGMRDLNALIPPFDHLGSVISEAHSIGELGQISALIGGGEKAPMAGDDHHEQDHVYRAFLLTP
jgi:probable HAF family extracellular repeat protein